MSVEADEKREREREREGWYLLHSAQERGGLLDGCLFMEPSTIKMWLIGESS